MKMKKLMALVLSAVMAVSMLAACGDGLRGGDVNLNKVNSILADDYDLDVKAQNSNDLNVAVIEVANKLKKDGPITTANANTLLYESRNYPLLNGTFMRIGVAEIVADTDVEALGGLDETAAFVMAVSIGNALASAPGVTVDMLNDVIDFYISAQKVNDTYWVFAVEMRADVAA